MLILFGAASLLRYYPWGLELCYLAMVLSVMTAYLRAFADSLGCKGLFNGPMAKPHRMALLSVSALVYLVYADIFYYSLWLMNMGLLITCFNRLYRLERFLQQSPSNPSD